MIDEKDDGLGGFEIPRKEYELLMECARTGCAIRCAPIVIHPPIDISHLREGSDMIRLRRGKPIDERGRWKLTPGPKGDTACISCPKCGLVFTIGGHVIDHLTSKVTPEVVCPGKCGFKDRVVLKGWTQRKKGA